MKEQLVTQRSFVLFLGNVVLVPLGLTLAMGMAEMLMRAFPNLIPSEVRVNPPTHGVSDLRIHSSPLRKSIFKLQAAHQENRDEDLMFN